MKIVSLTIIGVFALLFAVVAIGQSVILNAIESHESPVGAAELFSRNCAKCHGRDGGAKGFKAKATGTRNLTDAQWQDRVSDERIFNSINNGKGRMPAFGKKLSEADVDSLVQYVRSLKK